MPDVCYSGHSRGAWTREDLRNAVRALYVGTVMPRDIPKQHNGVSRQRVQELVRYKIIKAERLDVSYIWSFQFKQVLSFKFDESVLLNTMMYSWVYLLCRSNEGFLSRALCTWGGISFGDSSLALWGVTVTIKMYTSMHECLFSNSRSREAVETRNTPRIRLD